MKHKIYIGVGVFISAIILLVLFEILFIKYSGKPVPVPDTPRAVESYGIGPELSYIVLGDSTAVGQGGDYDQGIARSTARFLSSVDGGRQVTLRNVAVSGSRAADVLDKQIPLLRATRPDVVLLAVTANDVTHFTSTKHAVQSVQAIILALQTLNPAVKIVLTGAPAMGSVPRFPQPIRALAGIRTADMNHGLDSLVVTGRVTRTFIAEKTGPTFAQHPKLFAADKFHPTTNGYAVWIPLLEASLRSLTN